MRDQVENSDCIIVDVFFLSEDQIETPEDAEKF